jgi:hypothetical protein
VDASGTLRLVLFGLSLLLGSLLVFRLTYGTGLLELILNAGRCIAGSDIYLDAVRQ